ncbi:homeobox protein TGIF2LX-like [Dipodomys merriami]|uniref:homeobox protein TGIF2LX-like n=1 Tax=Dipodomys merriami TaxID=94247 RepID=UPI003855D2B0
MDVPKDCPAKTPDPQQFILVISRKNRDTCKVRASEIKEQKEHMPVDSVEILESMSPEEQVDFSNFYLLVDAAVQRAAERELEKKREHSS